MAHGTEYSPCWVINIKNLAGRHGRVSSALDCQAGGQRFKSQHPTSVETHMWEEWLAALLALYTGKCVTAAVYHIRLCKVRIRQNPLWLWNPEKTSPEVQNRGTVAPQMDMSPTKIKKYIYKWRTYPLYLFLWYDWHQFLAQLIYSLPVATMIYMKCRFYVVVEDRCRMHYQFQSTECQAPGKLWNWYCMTQRFFYYFKDF